MAGAGTAGLRLEVRDFADLTKWRWVLTGPGGAFAADHEVTLDPAYWQYEAFTDLLPYLSWNAAPDKRASWCRTVRRRCSPARWSSRTRAAGRWPPAV